MTTKQRAYLKSLAMKIEPIFSDWKIKYESGTDRGCFRSFRSA